MALLEGAGRIKVVGKFIILIGSTIGVLFWMLFFTSASPAARLLFLLLTLIVAVAPGGLVYALGWILEGYKQSPTSRR